MPGINTRTLLVSITGQYNGGIDGGDDGGGGEVGGGDGGVGDFGDGGGGGDGGPIHLVLGINTLTLLVNITGNTLYKLGYVMIRSQSDCIELILF